MSLLIMIIYGTFVAFVLFKLNINIIKTPIKFICYDLLYILIGATIVYQIF